MSKYLFLRDTFWKFIISKQAWRGGVRIWLLLKQRNVIPHSHIVTCLTTWYVLRQLSTHWLFVQGSAAQKSSNKGNTYIYLVWSLNTLLTQLLFYDWGTGSWVPPDMVNDLHECLLFPKNFTQIIPFLWWEKKWFYEERKNNLNNWSKIYKPWYDSV